MMYAGGDEGKAWPSVEVSVGNRLTGDCFLRFAGVSGELVQGAPRCRASCTNGGFSFTAEDFGYVPSSVLYNDAFAGLLGLVFGDILL